MGRSTGKGSRRPSSCTAVGGPDLVAVANAVPEVMTVVKYRTASNDDDGVGIVLELLLKALDGGAGKASNRNSTDRR